MSTYVNYFGSVHILGRIGTKTTSNAQYNFLFERNAQYNLVLPLVLSKRYDVVWSSELHNLCIWDRLLLCFVKKKVPNFIYVAWMFEILLHAF
jgi:hypothetical protein